MATSRNPTHARELGPLRFAFVVMADTHVNEADDASTSPYASTLLTNDRARRAVREIAAHEHRHGTL